MQLWSIILQIHEIPNKLDTVDILRIAQELNAIYKSLWVLCLIMQNWQNGENPIVGESW